MIISETKEFEIGIRQRLYSGEYCFDGNKLRIENVFTDDRKVEYGSDEFNDVYRAVENDKSDELNEWIDDLDSNIRESIAEDKADERRKY